MWGFGAVPPVSMALSAPHCRHHGSFVESSPTLFFCVKIIVALLSTLQFHMNFRISLLISTETVVGILTGIVCSLGFATLLTKWWLSPLQTLWLFLSCKWTPSLLARAVQLHGTLRQAWKLHLYRDDLLGRGSCSPEASSQSLRTPCGFYYLGRRGWNASGHPSTISCGIPFHSLIDLPTGNFPLLSPHFLLCFPLLLPRDRAIPDWFASLGFPYLTASEAIFYPDCWANSGFCRQELLKEGSSEGWHHAPLVHQAKSKCGQSENTKEPRLHLPRTWRTLSEVWGRTSCFSGPLFCCSELGSSSPGLMPEQEGQGVRGQPSACLVTSQESWASVCSSTEWNEYNVTELLREPNRII